MGKIYSVEIISIMLLSILFFFVFSLVIGSYCSVYRYECNIIIEYFIIVYIVILWVLY